MAQGGEFFIRVERPGGPEVLDLVDDLMYSREEARVVWNDLGSDICDYDWQELCKRCKVPIESEDDISAMPSPDSIEPDCSGGGVSPEAQRLEQYNAGKRWTV